LESLQNDFSFQQMNDKNIDSQSESILLKRAQEFKEPDNKTAALLE